MAAATATTTTPTTTTTAKPTPPATAPTTAPTAAPTTAPTTAPTAKQTPPATAIDVTATVERKETTPPCGFPEGTRVCNSKIGTVAYADAIVCDGKFIEIASMKTDAERKKASKQPVSISHSVIASGTKVGPNFSAIGSTVQGTGNSFGFAPEKRPRHARTINSAPYARSGQVPTTQRRIVNASSILHQAGLVNAVVEGDSNSFGGVVRGVSIIGSGNSFAGSVSGPSESKSHTPTPTPATKTKVAGARKDNGVARK